MFKRIQSLDPRIALPILALVLTLITMQRTLLVRPGVPEFENPWDHHKYLYMAQHGPWSFHIAPFCWRILAPLIAMVMPFQTMTNFVILGILATAAAGVAVFYVVREAGFPPAAALTGFFLYFSTVSVKFNLYEVASANSLTTFLVILGFLLILKKQDLLFAVVLALGALTKEPVPLLIIPFYTMRAERLFDWKHMARTATVALPAVIFFIGLHLWIPAKNTDPAYVASLPAKLSTVMHGQASFTYRAALEVMISQLRATKGIDVIELLTFAPFGLLFLLVPFGILRHPEFSLRIAPYMAVMYAQAIFSSSIPPSLAFGWTPVLLLGMLVIRDTGVPFTQLWPAALSMWALNLIKVGGFETPILIQVLVASFAIAISMRVIPRTVEALETPKTDRSLAAEQKAVARP
jgi:hypothetical protein